MKHNKKIMIVFGSLVILAAAVSGSVLAVRSMAQSETILWVNGAPISKAEFEQAMQTEYANTYDYFTRTYQAKVDENFWETTFGTENPLEYTKKIVKERLILEKTEELFGQEKRLGNPVDYDTKLKNWEQENEERKKMADNNEPVFGPVYLGLQQYENKIHGELKQKIKDKLYQEAEFSEDMLTDYYEAHKSEYFRKPSEFVIQYITVPAPYKEEGVKDEKKDAEIRAGLNVFLKKLEGRDFEAAAKDYEGQEKIQGMTFVSEKITWDSFTRANMLFPNLMQKLERMQAGELSGIVEERNAYYIAICNSKSEGEYESREAVEENIKRLIIEEQYADIVQDMMEHAKIRVNQKEYDDIKFQNGV